jgi:protein TonB
VDDPPRLLARSDAEYPEMERRAGVEGTVWLEATVNADGTVAGISVSRGASPGLDRAAVEALQRADFAPARRDGVPVEVRVQFAVEFRPL